MYVKELERLVGRHFYECAGVMFLVVLNLNLFLVPVRVLVLYLFLRVLVAANLLVDVGLLEN